MRFSPIAILLALTVNTFAGEPIAERRLTKSAEALTLVDASGKTHSPADWKTKTAVLVFVGLECPVANAYVPEVLRISHDFADGGYDWIGVHSDVGVNAAQAAAHAKEYGLTMPLLLDGEQRLAAAVGAQRIGQVAVLHNGAIVYRGRIDDRFSINGKRRDEPSTHELRDVLTAIQNGKPIPEDVAAYGCPIPFPKMAAPK